MAAVFGTEQLMTACPACLRMGTAEPETSAAKVNEIVAPKRVNIVEKKGIGYLGREREMKKKATSTQRRKR